MAIDPGDGATRTHIRGKKESSPVDVTDGYLVYDGAGGSCSDSGLDGSSTYYYRAWSWVEDHQGADMWSDVSSEASASTDAVPPTEELQIVLQPGWNMVSVPLLLPDMSAGVLFPDAEAIYAWNPVSKSYVQPQELEPSLGYWVASAIVQSVTLVGVPVESWTEPLAAGWNMMGSVYGSVVDFTDPDDVPDGSVEGFTYTWGTRTRSPICS